MDEQAEAESALLRAAAQEIVDFLPAFTALLDVPDEDADQEQPYGTLKPRLGRRRLTVIEFGKALLASGMPLTVTAIMASAFVPKAMQLFQVRPLLVPTAPSHRVHVAIGARCVTMSTAATHTSRHPCVWPHLCTLYCGDQ